MSQPMNNAKEIVEKLLEKVEKENHTEQLQNISKLIDQNKAKIWLRTRSGKPMAAKMETTAQMVWEKLSEGSMRWTPLMKMVVKESPSPWKAQVIIKWLLSNGYISRPERGVY